MKPSIILGAALAIGAASSVAAAEKDTPPIVGEVVKCRSETDDARRLACYDRAAGALEKATSDGSIAVVSREDVRKTRRSLFGFTLPKLPFFSGDDSAEADTPDEIETSVKSARMTRDGNYTLVMADDAVWRTTEPLRKLPKTGDKVKIKKAALGSYFLSVAGLRGVRALRVG
jgi:hypothetical protein